VRSRILWTVVFLLLIAAMLAPLAEGFDRWDSAPGLGQDTEFQVAALAMGMFAGSLAVGQQAVASRPIAAKDDALPVYIEEFFLSEAVRSEDKGELQFTVDALAQKRNGSPEDGSSAELDVEFGLTRRLQLGLELPYGISATQTSELPAGWSSMNVNVVYQFIRSNRPFALSAGVGMNLPVTGRGETSFEPEVLVAKAIGKAQVHASVIPEIGDDGNGLAYNLAALRPVPKNWIPTLEFNGRRSAGVDSFYVTPGIYKHLPHRMEAGIGVPVGMGRMSSRVGVIFKMTVEFGDKDD